MKLSDEFVTKLINNAKGMDLTFDADEIIDKGQKLFQEVCVLSEKLQTMGEPVRQSTLTALTEWQQLLARIDFKLIKELDATLQEELTNKQKSV